MNTIIKRWADPAIPFLCALLFEFAFRNLPSIDAQHPDWCWSNKNARAIDFHVPTPSKMLKCGEIFFWHNNNAIYGLINKLHTFVIFEMPNIGLKVAAAFSFQSRAAKRSVVNISYCNIFARTNFFWNKILAIIQKWQIYGPS